MLKIINGWQDHKNQKSLFNHFNLKNFNSK